MFPIPPNEHLIETKVCKHCRASFPITDKDMEFYEKVSPVFAGKKYSIPTPTLCPDCRQQRRLAYRMERKLYKRKCHVTGKDIVSMYSSDKKDIVFEYEYWWGDAWNPMDYGRDFDFSKGFFEQFRALSIVVPKCHIEINPSENSIYTNQAGHNKNCYLIFEAGYNEECGYSNSIWYSKDTYDSSFVLNNETCYECLDIHNSFKIFYSQECYSCRNSWFLIDCENCEFCIGCSNLRGKKYYVLNQLVSKEKFEEIQSEIQKNPKKKEEYLESYKQIRNGSIHCSDSNNFSEFIRGDHIINSKNIIGYDISESEDIRYGYTLYTTKDCMDYVYWGNNSMRIYEGISIGSTADNISFSYMCYNDIRNLIYCMNCVNGTNNCFGCVGLRQKQYCIFNKQYTKEEYEVLVPKIIEHMMKTGEWGEFFPSSLSPFGYNETVAMEYFPLSRKEVLENPPSPPGSSPGHALGQGGNETFLHGPIFNWSDYEAPFPKVDKIIPASKLPDDISKIPDDILNWAIECEVTKKPFRIIRQELEFYRKHNLPIPRRHPDQRHLDRMALRNPRKLFERKCDKCGKDMITSYSPEREEIVYCEECYNKEVIG